MHRGMHNAIAQFNGQCSGHCPTFHPASTHCGRPKRSAVQSQCLLRGTTFENSPNPVPKMQAALGNPNAASQSAHYSSGILHPDEPVTSSNSRRSSFHWANVCSKCRMSKNRTDTTRSISRTQHSSARRAAADNEGFLRARGSPGARSGQRIGEKAKLERENGPGRCEVSSIASRIVPIRDLGGTISI